MKRGIFFIALVITLIFISSCETTEEIDLSPTHEEPGCGEIVPGIINVKFKEKYDVLDVDKASNLVNTIQSEGSQEKPLLSPKKVTKVFNAAQEGTKNREVQDKIGLNRWVKISLPPSTDLLEEVAKWSARPEVEEVEFEYAPCLLIMPTDNRFSSQWYHHNTGANNRTFDSDIDSPEAWDLQRGDEILIATPDTSIFWHHEDLIDHIWRNLGEDADGDGIVIQPNGTEYITANYSGYPFVNRSYTKYIFDPDDVNGLDDDNNGYVDDFIGWDFGSNDNDPIYNETYDSLEYQWHGTQTAGHAAAVTNNSIGLATSCWNCNVMAMRRGAFRAEAIQYAVDNGARIVSMSWVSYYTGAMADVLNYAHELDVLLFTGAGNFATDDGGTYNSLCFNENIICIAGSTAYNASWRDSSYIFSSGKYSDFGAPSASMVSVTPYNHPLSKYVWSSGTSLGSPLAASVAALVLSENQNLTADEVKSLMLSSLDPYGFVHTDRFAGDGVINTEKAVMNARISNNYESFPVNLLNAYNTTTVANYLNIFGTVTSPDFVKYEVYTSVGHYTNNWTLINESFSPVENNIVYPLDLTNYEIGEIQIKVIAYDSNNQTATDIMQHVIEYIPDPVNQSINLTEGWNLFSPNITSIDLTSDQVETFLIAGYKGSTLGESQDRWEIDLASKENDSFLMKPWQGYFVYSNENKTINLQGYVPASPYPSLDWTGWNLISFNKSESFSKLYFDHPSTKIYNITFQNDTIVYEGLSRYDNLTRGRPYWVTINPDLSPPRFNQNP